MEKSSKEFIMNDDQYEELSAYIDQLDAWKASLIFIDHYFDPFSDYVESDLTNRYYYCSQLFHLFYQDYGKLISSIHNFLEFIAENETSE